MLSPDDEAVSIAALHQREEVVIHVGKMPQTKPLHPDVATTKAEQVESIVMRVKGVRRITIMNDRGITRRRLL
jgi:hypothetical protein